MRDIICFRNNDAISLFVDSPLFSGRLTNSTKLPEVNLYSVMTDCTVSVIPMYFSRHGAFYFVALMTPDATHFIFRLLLFSEH